MDFDKMQEIAAYLGKNKDASVIARIKELVEDKKFFLTFWGHFSSGKSSLINNLLGRKLLPVRTTETTAVLTYIQYGQCEECKVVYENKKVSLIKIEDVKEIFQNSSEFSETENIDHLEISIDNEILKSGIVIVDTPGVNTLIQRHQDLASSAIEQSGKIVYVLGGSPSDVDRKFIQQIHACGIEILFARTNCDKFKASEENAEQSIADEKRTVEEFIGERAEFVPLSNEDDSYWFDNIEILKSHISYFASDMENELQAMAAQRLKVIAEQMKPLLEEEKTHLAQDSKESEEEIRAKIEKCELNIKELERFLDKAESRIEQKLSEANKTAKRELNEFVESAVKKFDASLDSVQYSQNVSKEMKAMSDDMIEGAISNIQKIMNVNYSEIIKDELNVMEKMSDARIAQNDEIELPDYSEVQMQNSLALEKYNAMLLAAKERLEEINSQKNAVELKQNETEPFDENEFNQEMKALDAELQSIPSGMALRFSENQPTQPSEVFKNIGHALDFTLLLLPGDAIAAGIKGAADATKLTTALKNMGKTGEVIFKTGATLANSANSIDKVRDITYASNHIFGKRQMRRRKKDVQQMIDIGASTAGNAFEDYKQNAKSGNVLDMLSVSYWTEKFGRMFDSPPALEVDTVEEQKRKEARDEIRQRQRQLINSRIEQKKRAGLIASREKELAEREKAERELISKIETEMKAQEDAIIKNAQEEALEKAKKSYRGNFERQIETLSAEIEKEYEKTASQNIVMFIASQNVSLKNEIEESKAQLQNLLEMKKKGDEEISSRLARCDEYLRFVRDVAAQSEA